MLSISLVPSVSATRPGCYTDYRFGEPAPYYNFDIFVTWEVAPEHAYIYPAFCFGFEAGQGGYMGTQIVGNVRKVIFSIWDITEGVETAIPVSSNGRRFGGEGTGAQCLLEYDWVPNREYRLRIWELNSDAEGESWIASVYDTATGNETTIGIIYLKNSRGYKGYGWLKNDPSTFLEYFGGSDTCSDQPYSKVTWRGPYANNGEYTASTAQVPAYPDCTTNNVLSSGWPYVTHEAGDDVEETTPSKTYLWSAISAGTLIVDVDNQESGTLAVNLLVDGLTYSVKNVPGQTTVAFGGYTLAKGTHTAKITWIEPTDGTTREDTKTVLVNSGDTATIALQIVPPSNQPPTAYIDSISPNPAQQGQSVSFSGHGNDPDGSVVAYEWRSSIDGFLSNSSSFSTSSLSVGTHTISFRVQDNDGAWSSTVTATLTINSPSAPPAVSGFPIESILLGMAISIAALTILRKKKSVQRSRKIDRYF